MVFPLNIDWLEETLGTTVLVDEPLRRHTSFAIGGPARAFVETGSLEILAGCLRVALANDVPLVVIGGGTNILVSDDGFDGLVVKPAICGIELHEDLGTVTVGASFAASALVDHLVERGFAGLEFAAGLPGTVGGAVSGNAGCFGSTFGERLVSAKVITAEGQIATINGSGDFGFGYRSSTVAGRSWLVAEVTLSVEPDDRARLLEVAASHKETRRVKHPAPTEKTAGSYFKNLPPESPGGRRRAAGELLDRVGAREMSVGDAAVFERHANIVINRGNATARQILELTGMMAARVREEFAVVLEPEVRYLG